MSDLGIFQQAAKRGLRFPSSKGLLTVEDLYILPLQTTRANQPSLDSIAQVVNKSLKASGEESFVSSPSVESAAHKLQLDVLKEIIADKQADNSAVRGAAEKKQKRDQLIGLIADKKTDALGKLSVKDLEEQLAAL